MGEHEGGTLPEKTGSGAPAWAPGCWIC